MPTRLLFLACLALATVTAVTTAVDASRATVPRRSLPAHRAVSTAEALPRFVALRGPDDAVAVTTTAPPPPTTTTTAEVIPASRTVFIVGDSLTVGAAPFLPDALRSVHWGATAVDAVHGRKTAEGLAVLAAHQADLPPTVIVALGTNDLDATAEVVDGWVKQARTLVGNRRLIWVNLHLDDRPQFASYHGINSALADAAGRYHVELADWAGWSTANGVAHLGDGVHYPLAGYARRAEFYALFVHAKH